MIEYWQAEKLAVKLSANRSKTGNGVSLLYNSTRVRES